MSIPGQAKSKYTHEVKYVRSRCGWFKLGIIAFVIFLVGMLIGIMCNVSNIRRRQEDMFREMRKEIDNLRRRNSQNGNHETNYNPSHDQEPEGPQPISCQKNHNNKGIYSHCSPPHHHRHNGRHNNQHNPSIEESINELKSILNTKLSQIESSVEKINNSLNTKELFMEKVSKQMRDFQDYMGGLLQPLKKIQSWF